RLKSAALDEVLRLIREEEPPRPSTRLSTAATLPQIAAARRSPPAQLGKVLRAELDWIVMKSLEKDRARRYETAIGLARDVERYLKDEPVEACPPTLGYRFRKVYRKHRAAVLTAGAFAAVLLAGVAASLAFAVEAERANKIAHAEELNALSERDEKDRALKAETLAKEAETVTKNRLAASLRAEQLTGYDLTIPLVQRAMQENDLP